MVDSRVSVITSPLTSQSLKISSHQMRQHSQFGTLIIMVNSANQSNIIKIGLIDALELFSGLIIFSDSKAEDKIRCML